MDLNSERLADSLGLNIDLARAIANAHDLGYGPFGHVFEREMDSIFKELDYKGFDHNEQSLKVVEKLEQYSPYFDGLNLTKGVIDGIKVKCPGTEYLILEGQLVDLADTISYLSDDIEDALYLGFLSLDDFLDNLLMGEVLLSVKQEIGSEINMKLRSKYIRKHLKRKLRQSIYRASKKQIDKYRNYLEKGYFIYTEGRLINVELDIGIELDNLKKLLFEKYYFHKKIIQHEEKFRSAVRDVFFYLIGDISMIQRKEFLIEMYRDKDVNIYVKDYLALLTEKNFWRLHALINKYLTACR